MLFVLEDLRSPHWIVTGEARMSVQILFLAQTQPHALKVMNLSQLEFVLMVIKEFYALNASQAIYNRGNSNATSVVEE